ncbi:hypothetical protein [Pseudoneobacillus sp. C159]
MKKQFLIAAIAILFMISITAVIKENEQFDTLKELQVENKHLLGKVSKLESELRVARNNLGTLENRNRQLEEEVDTLTSSVSYQDFLLAKNTVESYKVAKTFDDATQYLGLVEGLGISSLDPELNCPCFISNYGKKLEWKPHVVTELKEFKIEKGKILLTYKTKSQQDYQFMMTKALGWKSEDQVEDWRIESIFAQ